MKRCPTCSRVYDDMGLRFCFDDGTELVNKVSETGAPETFVLSQEVQPTIPAVTPPLRQTPAGGLPATVTSKKQSLLPWLIGGGALLLLVAGVAVAGVLLLFPKRPLVMHLVLEVDPSAPDRDAAVKQSVAVIENRLDALGVSNFQVKAGVAGSGHVLVDLPALNDPERIKKVIGDWGKLELVHVVTPPYPSPVQTYPTEEAASASLEESGSSNRRIMRYRERQNSFASDQSKWVVVESPAIIEGNSIKTASAVHHTGEYYDVTFYLNKTGAEQFGAWTGANINAYMGVALNNEVTSVAFIKSQIFDSGEITGAFSKQAAEDLALILKAGALPARLKFVEERVDTK